MKDKLVIATRVLILAILTSALLNFETWAVQPVVDTSVHGPFHFRDFRTENLSGLNAGDFLSFGVDVLPNGDFDPVDGFADSDGPPILPTTVVATQGPPTCPSDPTTCTAQYTINFSPSGDDASGESIDPNHYVRSIPYDASLTGSWLFTINNGGDVITAETATVGDVASMPKVKNMSLTGSGTTPTFHWSAPEIPTGLSLDGVSIEIRDLSDRGPDGTRTARRIFAETFIDPGLTSFDVPSGVLLPDHLYEVGIRLDYRRRSSTGALRGTLSRSRSYFGFATVFLDVGNAPVFLPTVRGGGDPALTFEVDVEGGQTVFIDPPVAIGYDYQIGAGNPNFKSVSLPAVGDNLFDIYLWNQAENKYQFYMTIGSNVKFDFPAGGVDRFRVLGIEAGAGLDPNNATAFVTGLTFVSSGQFTGTMTPIVAEALCSTLGDDRKPSLLDQDMYTFQGTQGEELKVGIERSGNGGTGDKATLMLVDNIHGAFMLKIDNGELPNEVGGVLPASGEYLAIVAEQPLIARGSRYRGPYYITVQSSGDGAQTLQLTGWVE
jgi:hypothetical protein